MILMVYNKQICKEFLLPNIHNADYELLLERQIFSFEKDLELKLQNSQKGWELISTPDYSIRIKEDGEKSHTLKGQDILNIKTKRGERFQIVVIDEDFFFPVWKKYDISHMKEISVGKSEGNIIQYNYMDLLSLNHAGFIHQRDGWYVEDFSRNGTFCGNRRIQDRRRLQFGDHIEIFGLHILFLGRMLAVGTFYGELLVKEDILKPLAMPEVPIRDAGEIRKKETNYFHRSPRNLPVIYADPVEIEAPPTPQLMKEKPVFLTIGPAFTMAIPMMLGCGFAIFGSRLSGYTSGAFMYTGLITAVASALIGGVWAVMNMNYAKKESTEGEERRFNAYSNYLMEIADTLRNQYRENVAALNQMYPSAAQCVRYDQTNPLLWNRNFTHEDFLYERLGMGELPFQVDIEIPKEKFTLINDSLASKPHMIKEEFQTLKNVPVGISLTKKRLIGLVGGDKKIGAIEMMHSLVAGITASHSYTDVKLVFIYDEKEATVKRDWECMRWFPHVWSEDKGTRYMASTKIERNDIFFELSNVIRGRSQDNKEIQNPKKKILPKPYYVLFVSDPALLEGEILGKYIYEAKEEYGITTFLMVESLEQLPNSCEEVIQNDAHFKGFYNLMNTSKKKERFLPDYVDPKELENFGKLLSEIRVNEVESNSEIPTSLNFLEMYEVSSPRDLKVQERWRLNRNYHTMRALIGKKAGNANCYLDIHEKFHGPHGLVAGTTGSGKSETLQTYILSLAVEFSPEDVSFFIIDFKGGGMANLFSDLPHLSGQISNLSGNQVRRAMISIKSENQRRQRIFSEYGVNNINLYTKMYKNHGAPIPIPHLFIIIDEFAELKREEPEFMRELISVAQVGRSLGVHLILATQKPSGTVDDNIWSNSRFRLCLRVQDRQDSNDMLHKPDAAFITQAGRGYLQVGNDEIYEFFQSGYSGAIYDEESGGKDNYAALLTRAGKEELTGAKRKVSAENGKDKTELQAVIEHLREVTKEAGYQNSPRLWLPVLETEIYLDQLEGYSDTAYNKGWKEMPKKWSLSCLVGLYDDPEGQAQKPVEINLSEGGHLAVVGSVVSGKSTFLQTLIYSLISKYSPETLQMYLVDYSSHLLSAFEHAPHVGGLVYDNQEEKLDRFIHLLTSLMDERKKLFAGGNYSQYVQVHGVTLPAILVALDNYASFREKTKNKYDDVIMRLVREGVGYGIYLVITAAGFSMAEIPSRLGDNLRTVISLEQADKFKYMEVLRTTKIPLLPEVGVKGRGLALVNGRILEFQTALSLEAQDDFNRGQKIDQYCTDMAEAWMGVMARKIPEIPENPTLTFLKENPEYQEAVNSKRLLPFAYGIQDASIYGVQLNSTYCYSVSGKSRTGKTNVLKLLLSAALAKKADICLVEKDTLELKAMLDAEIAGKTSKEEDKISYVRDSKELFSYFDKLVPEFVRRNKLKHKLMDEGLTEDEIFRKMSKEKPIFIFLGDLSDFFSMVYKPGDGVGNMSGFLENILEKGSLHNIYFIGSLKVEEQGLLMTYRGYSLFTSYRRGIHLGGNLISQKLFKFQNIPYMNQSKAEKRGLGYVPDEEEENQAVKVIVPLAK